jgi:hypothetical protein
MTRRRAILTVRRFGAGLTLDSPLGLKSLSHVLDSSLRPEVCPYFINDAQTCQSSRIKTHRMRRTPSKPVLTKIRFSVRNQSCLVQRMALSHTGVLCLNVRPCPFVTVRIEGIETSHSTASLTLSLTHHIQ